MSIDADKALELKRQGKSLRQIAEALQVSKSSVHRHFQKSVEKSWLNPVWTSTRGDVDGPVDAYGAIPDPTKEALCKLYEDTVYVATKWLSDTISAVPLKCYVATMGMKRQPKCLTAPLLKASHLDHLANLDLKEVLEHPFRDIIMHPNPHMSLSDVLRIVDIDLSLCGEAFLYKHREEHERRDHQDFNEGLPQELWPLPAQWIDIATNDAGMFVGFHDNRFNYPKFIPADDIIWFKFVDPNNPYGKGYGPVRGAYERVLLGKQELAYLASLYRNQARPDSIIAVKDIVAAEAERMQKELNMRFRQGGQHGVWVVPAEEVDIKPLGWAPKDVLGVELYKFTRLTILNAFGLNVALFDTEHSNRAVADTAFYVAMRNAVVPRLKIIEDKINQCLAPDFDTRLRVAFEHPVSEDGAQMLAEHTAYLEHNVMTVNEVRKTLGMPPVAWGDERPSKEEAATTIASDKENLLEGNRASD